VVIFMDSMASAKRALDPSPHSGQGHSLAVCKCLGQWFAESPDHKLAFIQSPSSLKWGIHGQAHDFVCDIPPVPCGRRPVTSLDTVRKAVTDSALAEWQRQFLLPGAAGSQFMHLETTKGGPLLPTYANGGTWLKVVAKENSLCARMVRCITNHTPIGEYYHRFNIDEHYACKCDGVAPETRDHLFRRCKDLYLVDTAPRFLEALVGYLELNPSAFAFRRDAPPDPPQEGVG